MDLNSLQVHFWSGLDEHWNGINYLECRGRTKGMGAVNLVSAQRQYNVLNRGERREYSLDPPLSTKNP